MMLISLVVFGYHYRETITTIIMLTSHGTAKRSILRLGVSNNIFAMFWHFWSKDLFLGKGKNLMD